MDLVAFVSPDKSPRSPRSRGGSLASPTSPIARVLSAVGDFVFQRLDNDHSVVHAVVEHPAPPPDDINGRLLQASSSWSRAGVVDDARAVSDFLRDDVLIPRIDRRVDLENNITRVVPLSACRRATFTPLDGGPPRGCVAYRCPCLSRNRLGSAFAPAAARDSPSDVSRVLDGMVHDFARARSPAERNEDRADRLVKGVPEYAVDVASWRGYLGLYCHACGRGTLAYPEDGVGKHDLPDDPRGEAHVPAIRARILAQADRDP